VKPGNVLISRDGRVKVTDFGIARAVAEAQMTLPGTTLGSVHYFSPEQARGEQATAASDVFALGIVLFELLTGQRPWEGDSAASVAMARLAGPVADPSTKRAGIPPELVAIDRRALAMEPADRWSSAGAFADALEAFLSGAPIPGLGAIGGATVVGAVPTVAATARANPRAVPYAPDAYVGSDDAPMARRSDPYAPPPRTIRRDLPRDDDEERGTSPLVWAAGVVAILILALAGFLVFQLLSGPKTPVAQTVTVPNFVDKTFNEAQTIAQQAGITVVQAETQTDPTRAGIVLAQDPPAGDTIERGGTVNLTVAVGLETVAVPDLRGKTEQEAFQLIAAAGLQLGTRTEVFDPLIPAGQVVSQEPAAGIVVNQGTAVSYGVSKGPEPSPSPSPSPSPTPTPTPTPPPTPPPTAAPTPEPLTVGDYVCLTVGDAKSEIESDGFTVGGVIPADAPDSWFVSGQAPDAGSERPEGFPVTVTATEAKPESCP
jgi:serine/threonine-protein kinase